MPVANIPSRSRSRAGCRYAHAMASNMQIACTARHDHLPRLTCERLTMLRCPRASRAFLREVAISRWAPPDPGSGRETEILPQCLGEGGRCDLTCANAPRHHWPLLGCRLPNLLADRRMQCALGSPGKQAARISTVPSAPDSRVDGRIGAVDVAPDLGCSERDEKDRTGSPGGSNPGEMALKARARSPLAAREGINDSKDYGCKKVSRTKYDQRHPWYRQVMQPVAHPRPFASGST
jgi:hypothetical protein